MKKLEKLDFFKRITYFCHLYIELFTNSGKIIPRVKHVIVRDGLHPSGVVPKGIQPLRSQSYLPEKEVKGVYTTRMRNTQR